jgi:hypothetical protein
MGALLFFAHLYSPKVYTLEVPRALGLTTLLRLASSQNVGGASCSEPHPA